MFQIRTVTFWLFILSHVLLARGRLTWRDMNETVARKEKLDVQLQDADDEFEDGIDDELDDENNWGYADSYDETKLKDWSVCNYSSEEECARISIVECGGKTYDPLTFKGGMNNRYGRFR